MNDVVTRKSLVALVIVCLTIATVAGIACYYGIEAAKIAHESRIDHDQERPRKIWERERGNK